MQYLALIYASPSSQPVHGSAEFGKMMEDYGKFTAMLKEKGAHLGGEGLKPAASATSVRVRAGKVETMDGPFAETKEHLGGYYMMNVPDLDTAMKYAALIPSAAWGTIELRPVMEY